MTSGLSFPNIWPVGRFSRGVTLIEILVTMGIASIFCAALYGFYQLHIGVLKVEELRLELRESSRLAVDFMVRELHMAGARPVRGSSCDSFERLTEAEAQRVTMQYDFRGNTASAPPDGCPDDPSERISYIYDSTEQMLKRATSTGAPQPFISDVPPEGFLLRYFDREGNELIPPFAAPERAAVRSVRIEVLTRKAHPHPVSAEPLEVAFASTVFFVSPPE
jgi:prepilin-type N-terminal cleavage/methylation domain-containing protein